MDTRQITPEQEMLMRQEAKAKIALDDALTRLCNNPDFQLVIINTYLKEEPVRLVHLLSEQGMIYAPDAEAQRRDNHEQMIGIARLDDFLRSIHRNALEADNLLANLDNALEAAASNNEESDEDY